MIDLKCLLSRLLCVYLLRTLVRQLSCPTSDTGPHRARVYPLLTSELSVNVERRGRWLQKVQSKSATPPLNEELRCFTSVCVLFSVLSVAHGIAFVHSLRLKVVLRLGLREVESWDG